MGKILIKGAIKREKNKIYYIDGNGSICEAERHHGQKKKTKSKSK